MKAMQLTNPGPVEDRRLTWSDVPIPSPKRGEILIEVSVCGICHTDLHQVENDLPMRHSPTIPGHQIIGRVAECGEDVDCLRVGDRVGVAWLHGACLSCDLCNEGLENLCHSAEFTGWDVDGGFAEYAVARAEFAYRIPDGFRDEKAAPLLCAGIIGYRSIRLSGLQPGQRLGLYGFGAAAHIAIQVARHWDCEVYVFTRGEKHRELARELGATWTGRSVDDPPQQTDAAIIFAPAGPIVLDAMRVLRKGGTCALGGIYMTPIPPMNYTEHLYHEKVLRSVTNATRRDGNELLDLASKIPIETTVQTFALKDANEALIALKCGEINGAGVLKAR